MHAAQTANHLLYSENKNNGEYRDLPDKLACQIKERLLIVVVALGRDLMVLEVLLSVKCNLLGFHLPVLDINFVATQDNGDVLTDSANFRQPFAPQAILLRVKEEMC